MTDQGDAEGSGRVGGYGGLEGIGDCEQQWVGKGVRGMALGGHW